MGLSFPHPLVYWYEVGMLNLLNYFSAVVLLIFFCFPELLAAFLVPCSIYLERGGSGVGSFSSRGGFYSSSGLLCH